MSTTYAFEDKHSRALRKLVRQGSYIKLEYDCIEIKKKKDNNIAMHNAYIILWLLGGSFAPSYIEELSR
ncbi:uncharacterized protein DS421_13g421670 [Arachis hypogaea]|nr:uncharacterized protein DS421_13g421670 [Arachis hypogaea]